ncbi:hypothetical protein ABZT03_28615 [Streptomyces sp. NPDC005574]|uniref:hypothetical protein n=1 Tax=Streptomyces sp. NPDC005574 TaxID=3156891 RepID=UPI0033A5EA0A
MSRSDNADLDNAVTAPDAVAAAHGTRAELPLWPMLFSNVTVRLLGSDGSPPRRRGRPHGISPPRRPSARSPRTSAHASRWIARAHDHVDAGTRGRVPVDIAHRSRGRPPLAPPELPRHRHPRTMNYVPEQRG